MTNPNFKSPYPITPLNKGGNVNRVPLDQAMQIGATGMFNNTSVTRTPLAPQERFITRPLGGPTIVVPPTTPFGPQK